MCPNVTSTKELYMTQNNI